MKICILYHPESEQARSVEEFAHEADRQQGVKIELTSLETREGADMARLYDIVKYPAVLAVRENGDLAEKWDDEQLPLMNDVAAYARS